MNVFSIQDLVGLCQCQEFEHNKIESLFSSNMSTPSGSCKHSGFSGLSRHLKKTQEYSGKSAGLETKKKKGV
jgi:hypothetical protein